MDHERIWHGVLPLLQVYAAEDDGWDKKAGR
jgi:hypothetical protein